MARVTIVRHGVHDHSVSPHVGTTARAHYPAIVASVMASSDYRDAGLAPAACVSPEVLVSREPIAVADGGLALYAAAIEWYEAHGVIVRTDDGQVRLTTAREHIVDRSAAERSRASRERARSRRMLQSAVAPDAAPTVPPAPVVTADAAGLREVIDAWQATQRPGIFATSVATASLAALVTEHGAERVRRSIMRASEVTTSAYPSLRLVGEITREGPDTQRPQRTRGRRSEQAPSRYTDAQWEDVT